MAPTEQAWDWGSEPTRAASSKGMATSGRDRGAQGSHPVPRSLAGTYGLKAAAAGPATWRRVGRKPAAEGRVVAETMEGHRE